MWQMKEKLTEQETIESQRAYCNTFFDGDQGRAVLCDMMRVAGMFDIVESDCADEQLILSNFVKKILKKCGIDRPKEIIDGYAAIAKTWRPPPQKEPEQGPLETNNNLLD